MSGTAKSEAVSGLSLFEKPVCLMLLVSDCCVHCWAIGRGDCLLLLGPL